MALATLSAKSQRSKSDVVYFSVIRAFKELKYLKNDRSEKRIIILGANYKYALLEVRCDIDWFSWINSVIPSDKIRRKIERISFGTMTVYRLTEELVKKGWHIKDVSPYGINEELEKEIEDLLNESNVKFLKAVFSDPVLHYSIRTISLESKKHSRIITMDSLTSLIAIYAERDSITDERYLDLIEALNKVLRERR